jgi:hypothetical protein
MLSLLSIQLGSYYYVECQFPLCITAHVGPSGVTHGYARAEDTERHINEQRLIKWTQTARTVLIWAQFLATAFSDKDSSKDTISCFAAALNVETKTLITSCYQLDGLGTDLKSMTALTGLLDCAMQRWLAI